MILVAPIFKYMKSSNLSLQGLVFSELTIEGEIAFDSISALVKLGKIVCRIDKNEFRYLGF